jgi:hypothetical protein
VSKKSGSAIHYDESAWPFVLITLPERGTTEDEFLENLRRLDEYAARGDAFGFVIDARAAPDPDANRRRAIAEYLDDCQLRHGDAFIGTAFVISSSTGRAVHKAILWLRQGRKPLLAVATPEDGLAQLRRLVKKQA